MNVTGAGQWIYSSLSSTAASVGNCSLFFDTVDTNNNNVVGLHEAIVFYLRQDDSSFYENVEPDLKLSQINCSICVENTTVYYMWNEHTKHFFGTRLCFVNMYKNGGCVHGIDSKV